MLEWDDDEGRRSIDFFVNSKARRNGFLHRACVIGMPPRLDAMDNNWSEYRETDKGSDVYHVIRKGRI